MNLIIIICLVTIIGLLLRIIHLIEEKNTQETVKEGIKIEKRFFWGVSIFIGILIFMIFNK